LSDALLVIQILVSLISGVILSGVALYFFIRGRKVERGLSDVTAKASLLLGEETDLVSTLQDARVFMSTVTEPELRAELLKGLASELLEVFNFWRMGVKSGENKKLAAVEGKLTEVFVEEVVPEMLEDPWLQKLAKIAMKNVRVKQVLQEHDLSVMDIIDLAGPLLSNIKLGQPGGDLSKPAQSDDGIIWFVQP